MTSNFTKRPHGRFIGPVNLSDSGKINWVSVIPKDYTPGICKMTIDLSHPLSSSVNDGINIQLCTLSYVMVNEVMRIAAELRKEDAVR